MRALVAAGGGGKGAWSCGVIKYLLGDLQIHYDILCGVSSGALNCAFLAQFPKGQEIDAAKQLANLWSSIDTKSIYKRWFPFGSLHSMWRTAYFDSSPLHKTVHSNISLDKIRQSGKSVSAGAVSLNSGKYAVFNQDDDCFIDAVIGSASFPGAFPPVKINGQYWSDGGVKTISPISTAIDLGATEIDLIITSPQTRIMKWIEHPSTVDIIKRSIDLSTDKIMANDIEKVLMYNRLAEAGFTDKRLVKINTIRPDFNLIEDLLDFTPSKIREMMILGYNDAKSKYVSNISA